MNELRPSGAEVMLELAAPEWQRLGCELYLLAVGASLGPQAERLAGSGWKLSHVKNDRGIFGLVLNVRQEIERIQPDVVHLHQEGKALALCLAVRLTGTPMFRTIHNNFPFRGALRIQKMIERSICRLLGSHQLAISQSVQENESINFKNPSTLCWNWFNTQSFRPPTNTEKREARTRLGISECSKVIVTVGNGSDIKNYVAVVEAVAALANPLVHYYQIGNPHPERTDETRSQQLGISKNVHFIGPRNDVLDWLWAADVYMMPSIFEGYGLAAVEGLAAGCACIFADCPGLSDFKDFEVDAVWCIPSSQHLANAIFEMLENPRSETTLQRNSTIIRQAFEIEYRSKAYHRLWNEASHLNA